MDIYASKAISLKAKANPSVANLSFGEPVFGPPEHLLESIGSEDLSLSAFLDGAKRYEDPRGSLALRQAIANWYAKRYGLIVDPEREVMVTHGGVEAITLALLATTSAGDRVAISDPSYMLYARTIKTLERQPWSLVRSGGNHEYAEALETESLEGVRAMIVNSPENPTGYVASVTDWQTINRKTVAEGCWLIHDEVYDAMDFQRPHQPAGASQALAENAILINSFSKKFGLPGLRIGWIVAPAQVIEQAAKAHDYLYLGVNIQYEAIACRLLSDNQAFHWLDGMAMMMKNRCQIALQTLTEAKGYRWPRQPSGAMFLFPEVSGLYQRLPTSFQSQANTSGEAVANYLLQECKVAAVPGAVYGSQGDNHIRLVLCTPEDVFQQAMQRMG
ncbi:pyridoxal phosphate-dependent aminotransferase [Spartinivicinus sp. A2-2]|uniref:Aminotransferase n=2 Tax=Spartinivicinus poritis TaxID=2994640 RepID=A0ABT5U7U9_9GAMM|nr:pyridoxal phosphate-dependent aminotransferase [Spartinivicinus sp. A2-2]MDE1462457.1 pyridoxal phosphate-dependent aminotransferase [Spartinivicinus sp. A2-2]